MGRIALAAQRIGLKPLLPGGSYFQELPLDISRASEATSRLSVSTASGTATCYTPAAFGIRGRWVAPGRASGDAALPLDPGRSLIALTDYPPPGPSPSKTGNPCAAPDV